MKLQMELCCRHPTNIRAQLIANSVQHGFGVWFTMILLLLAVNRITIIEYRHYLWRETYGRTPMAVSHWSLHTRICVCTATAVIDIHVMKHLPITHCNKPIASAYKLIVNNTFDIKLDIYIYILYCLYWGPSLTPTILSTLKGYLPVPLMTIVMYIFFLPTKNITHLYSTREYTVHNW